MIKRKHILLSVLTLGLSALLTGCKVVVLQPLGPVAADEKHLLLLALGLMLIVVIPVLILTVVIAIRYRASNKKAKYDPSFTHSNKLEAVWWTVPIIIIAILAVITWRTTHQLDPYKPLDTKALGVTAKPVKIEAIALRWKWLFIYPEQKIATVNYIQFPVKTPIDFYITSDAPMNSFQIQQLAGQIYAMNGMQTKLHVLADHVASYRARSVSFSGKGFSDMRFVAKSVTSENFQKWVAKVKRSPETLTMEKYKQVAQPSINHPPEFFSSVEPGLYKKVIKSFMMPADYKPSAAVKNAKPIQL